MEILFSVSFVEDGRLRFSSKELHVKDLYLHLKRTYDHSKSRGKAVWNEKIKKIKIPPVSRMSPFHAQKLSVDTSSACIFNYLLFYISIQIAR